ncbi:MAG: CoA ester lyase [Gammaproteobacteria bacterium]|nr:CoA ester lyase [Gammaproteobacteria bacterium]
MNDGTRATERGGAAGHSHARLGCRSILFVPGYRPDRFGKALAAGADAVCIDLEDAVPPQRKTMAREAAARFLAEQPAGRLREETSPPHLIIRINDPDTDLGRADAETLGGTRQPDAFMIPKVRTAAGLRRAARLLGDGAPLFALIETALGLENAVDIGQASPAVAGLVFGGFDLAIELRADPSWEPLLYARSRVVHAAALSGLDAIDMPSLGFREMSGLREEADRVRCLGFAGKMAIHPAQLPVIHEVFTPSELEVERARRILDADREAGGGAVALEGRMVDRPVAEVARRVLARARAAADRGADK